MALAFVQALFLAAANAASIVGTIPVGGVAAGRLVRVIAGCKTETSTVTIADTRGHTWVADVDNNTGSRPRLRTWSAIIVTPLQAGDTITVTWTTGGRCFCEAYEISGTGSSSWFDKSATNNGTDAAAPASTGTTATTAQANEIVFAALCEDGGASLDGFAGTPGSGFTVVGGGSNGTAGSGIWWETAYKIVSATGTYSMSDAGDSGRPWAGLIVTDKEATAPPPSTRRRVGSGAM